MACARCARRAPTVLRSGSIFIALLSQYRGQGTLTSRFLHGSSFTSFVQLHQNAIRVAEKDSTDVPLSIAKRIGWSTGLGTIGEQTPGDFFHIGNRKRYVTDADLIEHDGCATDRIARVLSQDEEGHRLGIAIAQVHDTPLGVVAGIQVR